MYESKDGVITSPGKFEGEPVWLPGLWDLAMQGFADGEDNETFTFHFSDLNDPMVKAYPMLGGRFVYVWETEQGFVCCRVG